MNPDNKSIQDRRHLHLLICICLISLCMKLFLLYYLSSDEQRFIGVDTPTYVGPAMALLENGAFLQGPNQWDTPETFRTPGYPIFLAFSFFVSSKNIPFTIVLQIFIFTGTLILTFLTCKKMFGSGAGIIAVILLAFDPPSFVHNFLLLTETLATFFTVFFVFSVVKYFEEKNNLVWACFVGLTLALATLVRPTTYYFFPVLLLLVAAYQFKTGKWGHSGRKALVLMVVPFILLVGGWLVRNWNVAGVLRCETQKGMALLYGKGTQILSYKENIDADTAMKLTSEHFFEVYPEARKMPSREVDKLMMDMAIKMIIANPGVVIKTQMIQLVNFMFEPGTTSSLFRLLNPQYEIKKFNWYGYRGYLLGMIENNPLFLLSLFLGLGYICLQYVCSFYGLFHFSRVNMSNYPFWNHLFIFLFICYVANIFALGSGYSRYRIVIMPIISIYAGAGIWGYLQMRQKH
ncbi:MAG: glycosyltransferase family 39 protein [Candidatus Electrothrix scaldis]|nr:MAG: glycosyltransferase family 39 protein [Candidatus Electrothrix sp. GW3-3]